jgi:hypothetical protein
MPQYGIGKFQPAKHVCENVPALKCRMVIKQVCSQVSYPNCQQVPKQEFHLVHKKVPKRVTERVAKKVCNVGASDGIIERSANSRKTQSVTPTPPV